MSRGPWMEAMEVQAALIERLMEPASALHQITVGFEAAMGRNAPKAAFVRHDGSGRFALTMPQWEAAALTGSQTYWVSAEMLDVVEHAAQTLDLSEPLIVNDLPTPHGFALLERSVVGPDARGRVCTYRAVSWTTQPDVSAETNEIIGDGGVLYTLWVDITDPADEVSRDLLEFFPDSTRGAGKFQIMHVGPVGFSRPKPTIDDEILPADDESVDADGRPLLPAVERLALVHEQQAWLRTFWRLIEQRVGHPTEERPDRATARRLARSSEFAPSSVTVVTLRRYSETQPKVEGEHGEECEGVKWSHRWMVRGHWRNQWYASMQRHRQIWIAPFVKGPEDQPLLLKPKVYRWTR